MQTMPPMVMARAPKAGAVQPLTRKIAAVAMRVAMVIPETGEAEEPTMPEIKVTFGALEAARADVAGTAARIANRLSDPPMYAIAPIDRCYALTGAIKTTWEGISGGDGVGQAVTRFFDELRTAAVKA